MGSTGIDLTTGNITGLKDAEMATRKSRLRDFLQVVLASGDLVAFLLAQLFAFWVRFYSGWVESLPASLVTEAKATEHDAYVLHFLAGTALFIAASGYLQLSSLKNALAPSVALRRIVRVCLTWIIAYTLLALFFRVDPPISRIFVGLSGVLGMALLTLWRILYFRAIDATGLINAIKTRIIVIGWTRDASRMWLRFVREKQPSVEFLGIVPLATVELKAHPPEKLPILGRFEELQKLIVAHHPDAVMLADLDPLLDATTEIVNLCHKQLVRFIAIPSFFEVLTSGVRQESLLGVPTITIDKLPLDHVVNRLFKRGIDVLGALVGLVLSAPIVAVFFVLVWLESPGSLIYAQTRTGRRGKPFRIYKIRSMKLNAESGTGAVWARENDDRRLRIGSFMRAWNIDELPQFWNILRGDMSLVGPRPERPELISEFQHNIAHYNLRLSVKPGLTGWAAVNGLRGDTDLVERIRFDIDYIERWNLWFDFYIMLLTFKKNENAY